MRSNGSSEGNGELRRHKQWEQQGEQDRWPAPGGVATGERVLVGLDFVFGFPNAFQQHLRWRGTTAWEWSAAADRATSLDEYLELQGRDWFKFGPDEHLPDEPLRLTDRQVKGSPASVFNLAAGAKQVGRGSIRGMAMLHRLLDAVQVWPVSGVDLDATARPVLVEMYPAMWLTKNAAKSQLPVRVREVEQLRKCLEFDEDVKLAAIGDDDALDALAILAGLHERDPAVELTRPLPEAAETEGWIWGVDPVSDADQGP